MTSAIRPRHKYYTYVHILADAALFVNRRDGESPARFGRGFGAARGNGTPSGTISDAPQAIRDPSALPRMHSASIRRLVAAAFAAWLSAGPLAVAAVAAPVLTLARPVDQARFAASTFATGLSFPTSMAELADGSLLVAESEGASLFGSASGRLVRLVDADGDGVADGPPQVLASGGNLPGLVTSVRRVGELVIALSSQTGAEAVTFWRTGLTPGAPLTYAGRIGLTFPAGAEHTTYALAARQAPDAHSDVEVYFNIGAAANSVATPPTSTVALTGSGLTFTPAAVVADSIHRLRVSDSEAGLAVSTPQQIARGLRNAAGMTFDAGGDLYLQDNGIDTEGNRGVSFSADELNRIPAATLGQTVLDFGFADTYVRYADGVLVNPSPTATNPLVAFLPLEGRRSEGAVEIAMAPAGFGEEFAGGVFTAFFGMGGQAGPANEENPVVFADPATGEYYHFVNNQVHGHPYGMLSTTNSLYMADLAWTGRLDAAVSGVPANEAGVIYRITPVPEPAAWAGIAAVLAIAGARARRQRPCRTPSAASPTSVTTRSPGSGTTEKVAASS